MNYEIGLWPGMGYWLSTHKVTAECAEQALEILAKRLIADGHTSLYLTAEDVDVDAEREGMDVDEYAESCNLVYVDGTMEGAAYPIYLRGENLKIIAVA